MVDHMKVTVEIPDALLADVTQAAAEDNSTVHALVEDGLRRVLAERRERKLFKLRDGRFRGGGIRPEYDGNWDKIRAAIYEGRGA
jgi:Arc/MetJ family transcription regulator